MSDLGHFDGIEVGMHKELEMLAMDDFETISVVKGRLTVDEWKKVEFQGKTISLLNLTVDVKFSAALIVDEDSALEIAGQICEDIADMFYGDAPEEWNLRVGIRLGKVSGYVD
jgi:hypothetical protein